MIVVWCFRDHTQVPDGEAGGEAVTAAVPPALAAQHGAGRPQRTPGQSSLLLPGNISSSHNTVNLTRARDTRGDV